VLSNKVQHQPLAVKIVEQGLLRGRVPHAYLFHGPDGVGKETLALAFAELLLCSNSDVDLTTAARKKQAAKQSELAACGRCDDCRGIAAGVHPDLHIVHRYLNREHPDSDVRKRKGLEISIDVIRHFLIEPVGRTPIRGRAKIFIVREADRMTVQAQNGLLKTLEEPPQTTFLILLADNANSLLPTTQSRCQGVPFDPLPISFVESRLGELVPKLTPTQRSWYARSGDGSIGKALEAAQDGLFELNERLSTVLGEWLTAQRSTGGRRGRAPDLLKFWTEEAGSIGDRYQKRDPDITDTDATRRGLFTVLRLTATWFADVLRLSAGGTLELTNVKHRPALEKIAGGVSPSRTADDIHRIAETERQLDLNANTQLCLETLVADLA